MYRNQYTKSWNIAYCLFWFFFVPVAVGFTLVGVLFWFHWPAVLLLLTPYSLGAAAITFREYSKMNDRTQSLSPKLIDVNTKLLRRYKVENWKRSAEHSTTQGIGVVDGDNVPMLIRADTRGLRIAFGGLEEDSVQIGWEHIRLNEYGSSEAKSSKTQIQISIEDFEMWRMVIPWDDAIQRNYGEKIRSG